MTEDLKKELSAIIREMKDTRVTSFLSIVKIDLASDNSYAKVYVSDLNGIEAAKTAVKGLECGSGYIKRELSNRLHLRKAPGLKFIADDSIEYSTSINKILEEIGRKEEQKDD
jgi:ribosome-binding factor A